VHLLAATGQPETFEQLRQLAVRDGVCEEVKTALLEAMYKLDQEAKRREKETIEATEVSGEPHFETPEAELVESKKELRFASAFELPTQSELLPEFHTEVVSEMEELAV
jgi:hypothetical protein